MMSDSRLPAEPDKTLVPRQDFHAPESEKETQSLRPSTPVCPRCESNLQAGKHPTGIAWRCPSCGGQSLNFSQFRRMVPEAHVDEIWVTSTRQPVAAPGRTRCPECRRPMLAVLVPVQDREIELDICRPCQRLWLENQEKLSKTLDSTHKNPGAAKGPKPPLVQMAGRPKDDQAHQDHREKLGKIRAMMLRRKADKKSWATPLIIIGVLYILLQFWSRK